MSTKTIENRMGNRLTDIDTEKKVQFLPLNLSENGRKVLEARYLKKDQDGSDFGDAGGDVSAGGADDCGGRGAVRADAGRRSSRWRSSFIT